LAEPSPNAKESLVRSWVRRKSANNGRYVDFTFNSVGFVNITLTLVIRTGSGFSNPTVVRAVYWSHMRLFANNGSQAHAQE
jgi:hypothetical protein